MSYNKKKPWIHHCEYCHKIIPVRLRDGLERTDGFGIKGRPGRYCSPCVKILKNGGK
tara:strand:+ start:101 stop:271 length:171 start_codon:yes stop_codon:yes gene_type:complete